MKKTTILALLSFVVIVLFNCQNELNLEKDTVSISQPKQIQNQLLPFSKTVHFNNLKKKIKSINKKIDNHNANFRTDSNKNIEILTDEVLYITYADTHTYTFNVLRKKPKAYIENVVLHYNVEKEAYDEYLIQYFITEEEFEALSKGELLQNSENVKITELMSGFFDTHTQSNFCETVCTTQYVSCASGEHDSGNVENWHNCKYAGSSNGPSAYQSCTSNCPKISPGEDGGSGGGGGNTTIGGNDNSTNDDNSTVISNPVSQGPCRYINENGESESGVINSDGECVKTITFNIDEDVTLLNDINDCLSVSTNSSTYDWLSTKASTKQLNSLNNYLKENCNKEASGFAKAAIEAWKNKGEVDFPNEIILDESFLKNKKLKCVYEKLVKDNSKLFRETVGSFMKNPKFKLTFTVGNCKNTNVACADDSDPKSIKIIIEDTLTNPIDLAAIILHESIHAEIAKYLYQHKQGLDVNDRPLLFQYLKYYSDLYDNNSGEIDHIYMTKKYIEPIKKALRQYDNMSYPLNHYTSYAWDGLRKWDADKLLSMDPLKKEYEEMRSLVTKNSKVCK